MTPRAGTEPTAFTSSSSSATDRTSAAVGAVRPQPVSTRRDSGGTDTEPEQHEPADAEHLQDTVAEHELYGCGAGALLEPQRLVKDPEHERDDRQLVPDIPAADLPRTLERPEV